MALHYLHLPPEQAPPQVAWGAFRAVLVSDVEVSPPWQARIAAWLARSGCLYVAAWGVACEAWHDAVDRVNIDDHPSGDIPPDRFIMTSWHAQEPLTEALWFAGQCAFHPDVELEETVIVHIASEERQAEMLERYRNSQTIED